MRRIVLFFLLLGVSIVTSCHQSPVQSQSDGCTDTYSQTNASRIGFQCVRSPEYIVALDEDSSSSCPFVVLRGKMSQYTFPGPPNFESIENGDSPETRWFFEIPQSEIQRLKEEKMGLSVRRDMFQIQRIKTLSLRFTQISRPEGGLKPNV